MGFFLFNLIVLLTTSSPILKTPVLNNVNIINIHLFYPIIKTKQFKNSKPNNANNIMAIGYKQFKIFL